MTSPAPWILASSLLVAGQALAGTTCSDPTGSNRYVASQYDGGAPPPPQMTTASEEGWVDGASLGQNEYSQDGGWKTTFKATFADQSRVDLGTVTDRPQNRVIHTYAARLTLADGTGAKRFEGLVICAESHWLIPPP